jgi:hypothetical protein
MLLPSLTIKSVFSTSFPNTISLPKWQEHYCEKYVSGSTSYQCSKKYVPSQPSTRTKTDEMAEF